MNITLDHDRKTLHERVDERDCMMACQASTRRVKRKDRVGYSQASDAGLACRAVKDVR